MFASKKPQSDMTRSTLEARLLFSFPGLILLSFSQFNSFLNFLIGKSLNNFMGFTQLPALFLVDISAKIAFPET